jgi:hypothetical protein
MFEISTVGIIEIIAIIMEIDSISSCFDRLVFGAQFEFQRLMMVSV